MLRKLIREAVSASASYLSKEVVRAHLQKMVTNRIKSGKIKNSADLAEFFATVDMSLKALKMIPFEVFSKLAV